MYYIVNPYMALERPNLPEFEGPYGKAKCLVYLVDEDKYEEIADCTKDTTASHANGICKTPICKNYSSDKVLSK